MAIRHRTDPPDRLRRSLSFFHPERMEKGFTLVELLIAMLITGIVAGSAITVFFVFIFHFEQTDELTTAQQNGEMVLTILRNPVLHAGLAIPSADWGDVFSPDLKPTSPLTGSLTDEFLDGPVTLRTDVGDGGADPGGNVLLVLYGVPSSKIVEESADLASGTEVTLDVSGSLADVTAYSSGKTETKNWILLPTAGVPLLIKVNGTNSVTLNVVETGNKSVATYDELYYLRGMRAFARAGSFFTEGLTEGSGKQKRVENIAAVFFKQEDTLLKVWVVAAGPKKHDEPLYEDWAAFKAAFPDWPGSDKFADFDSGKNWKYHRLRVLSESWRVRN